MGSSAIQTYIVGHLFPTRVPSWTNGEVPHYPRSCFVDGEGEGILNMRVDRSGGTLLSQISWRSTAIAAAEFYTLIRPGMSTETGVFRSLRDAIREFHSLKYAVRVARARKNPPSPPDVLPSLPGHADVYTCAAAAAFRKRHKSTVKAYGQRTPMGVTSRRLERRFKPTTTTTPPRRLRSQCAGLGSEMTRLSSRLTSDRRLTIIPPTTTTTEH